MKDILKEFEERFFFSDGILCETIGNSGHSCNLNDIKDFISKAIAQTREETIREAKREVKKYVSSKKKILHFNRIIAGEEILAILNKLKK